MIGHWMKDNNSKNWVLALLFVQLAKNTRGHSSIKNQPYILQYGQRCRHGCASLPIDRDVLLKLRSEDDLNAIRASIQFIMADTATIANPIADADADASADAIADTSADTSTETSIHDDIAEAATDLDAIADASADMDAFAEAVADPDAPDEFAIAGAAAETSVHDAIVFYEAAADIDAIAEYSADPDAIADASTVADPDATAIAEAAAETSVHGFAVAAAATSIPAENHCAKCKNPMSCDYLCHGCDYLCHGCDNPIHWFCSEGDEEENEGKGHGKHYWCHPCYQRQVITVLANTVTQYSPQDKENNQPEHDTPGRGALRSMASGNQTLQAERMKKRLREDTIQDIPVGGICLVPIDRVD
jgi:hypothetical protein